MACGTSCTIGGRKRKRVKRTKRRGRKRRGGSLVSTGTATAALLFALNKSCKKRKATRKRRRTRRKRR